MSWDLALVLGEYGVAKLVGGETVPVKRLDTSRIADYPKVCFAALKKSVGDQATLGDAPGTSREAADLRARMGDTEAEGREKDAEPADAPDDIRTLWVQRDEHGERFKTWRVVIAECRQANFTGGWSRYHEGPPSTLSLFNNLVRQNEDTMVWLSNFFKEFAIGNKERTATEMRVLVRAIWLSGVYDQVNGPALACIEELARRVSQLVEAYSSGAAGKPNFTSVKHFASVYSSANIVPSELRSFARQKCKS